MRKRYLSHRRPTKTQAIELAHKRRVARAFDDRRHALETLRKLQANKTTKVSI